MSDGPAAVSLRRLRLSAFRNYASLSVSLRPGLVVLAGENGAGKTNFLEAVSLLSPGRGMRRSNYGDLAAAGSPQGFAIHAVVDGPDGETEIGSAAGEAEPSEGTSRKVRINGTPARSADDLLDHLRVMWLTPAMDALFTGPAADRRRFLDRLVLSIDPAHGKRALDYEKAMRGRNRLLAEGSRDQRWLDAIEAQMAETGAAIAAARVEMVRLLAGLIARVPEDGPFPQGVLSLEGALERDIADRPAVDIESDFATALHEGRERDRAAGRTLVGPHRSDLLVRHKPKDMPAELCSTGEQKALLIGIVLAHARLTAEISGMTPILLLDEIAAHLDAGRRAALFAILEEIGCQAFMTGTEAQLFDSIAGRAQFLAVSHGTISEGGG